MDKFTSDRFITETGTRLLVQVPQEAALRVLQAITAADPLTYGDYDQVAFTTSPGAQQFRSLSGGRNPETDAAVTVPCVELQVFTEATGQELEPILRAIYDAHPYEEPVIQLLPAERTRHIRGMDEGNSNRFWNRETPDWVPEEHRPPPS